MSSNNCCCSSGASTKDTLSCCASPKEIEAAENIHTVSPSASDAFMNYMSQVNQPGAIDTKNKKLIALALSVVTKCEPCVKINTKAAEDAGASEAEVSESVAMGIAFGGASTAMFYNSIKS